jgi:uncharacterized protein
VTLPPNGAAQRPLPEDGSSRSGSALTRPPTMLTWQGVAGPRLESVRLLVSENRLRASGRLIVADRDGNGGESYSASFEVSSDETGTVRRLLLRTTTAEEQRQVSISRTEDGVWLIDHGQGVERDEFGGATEVDVDGAVLFNALPVRRLGLHREPGSHELPVVSVALPELSVRLTRQTYRTVSIGPEGAVINRAEGDSSVDLTVDADGFVVDSPGLARRV